MARTSGETRGARRVAASPVALSVAALAALASPVPGQAQGTDRWAALDGEAVARLPAPQAGGRIAGATLSCEAQRWTLALELTGTEEPPAEGGAALKVDGRAFPAEPVGSAGALSIRVPTDAIGPMKEGLRLEVDLSGPLEAGVGDAVFALRGSRVAISAVEERCTRRDMSAFTPVTFTPYSSYLNLVRELRAADIKAFAEATASQPEVSAAMVELGEGRRLLFARLCGSSWYFGLSGCNITGFASERAEGSAGEDEAAGEGASETWRIVYDTENVFLHTDPRSDVGGWPDLVTLPLRADGLDLVWRWNGEAYALHGTLPDEVEDAPKLQVVNE